MKRHFGPSRRSTVGCPTVDRGIAPHPEHQPPPGWPDLNNGPTSHQSRISRSPRYFWSPGLLNFRAKCGGRPTLIRQLRRGSLSVTEGADMRLADFILRDMQAILAQWEAFAATRVPAATSMTPLALRNHARQILEAVAKDLSAFQSQDAQAAKSMGRAPKIMEAPETAAQTHGFLRAQSGFQINQMASEYRALRASVLRLWMDACQPSDFHADDIVRFNEAIDQALAESIAFFSAEVDRARELFLGMLGHDMRTPLQAIQMTASYLALLNAGAKVSEAASRLSNCSARMKALLDDLVEFNRTKLGMGIDIAPTNVDMAALFGDELEQLRAAYPDRQLELEVVGDAQGFWDGLCLQRLLGNLVVNALKYGAQDAPVRVMISGEEAVV